MITQEMLLKVFICFLAGAGAGIGTGFAGMSAAGIIGPMLMTFCGLKPYQAIGIGLASDVLASAVSAWTYKKNKNLDVKNAMPMLISVLCMTIVGSFIASFLPDRAMGGFSQFGLLFLGIKFLLKPDSTVKVKEQTGDKSSLVKKAILGGTIVGFICGFVGAGGGMMMLFVLTSFLGYEIHMAVGTSVFIMAFTAFIGGASHFVIEGIPDITCLVLCVVFTLIWARIAAVIANKASSRNLSRAAGVVMVLSSGVVLFFNYFMK